MNRLGRLALILVFPLALGMRGPADEAEEWLRRGNTAFDARDYQAAIDCYAAAEGRITDPGLVALNQAAALYRVGRFREAELHYRWALQDARGNRRARVLYDLGTTLVREAGDSDAALLRQAVASLEDCLRQPSADTDLTRNARANLRLAKELLAGANPHPSGNRGTTPVQADDGSGNQESSPSASRNPDTDIRDNRPGAGRRAAPSDEPGTAPSADASRPPGVGDLPPIPDQDSLTPLSAADAAAYVRQAVARITQDRRQHRRPVRPPDPRILDW